MNRFVIMDERDFVATALVDCKAGEDADIFSPENKNISKLRALDDIPYGNKIALRDIESGEKVIKYGAVIGECTSCISKGELVHVHNLKSLAVDIPPAFKSEIMRQMDIKQSGGDEI
ncbi:MAG TPA: carbohydrate kinase [Spirochaeta sp.]|nr:carbohydrate kinase [Spirochaeta sp.]